MHGGCHCHVAAARALCLQEEGIDQCPTGIGVDLDKLRSVAPQVEIISHEHADGARLEPSDLGSTFENG